MNWAVSLCIPLSRPRDACWLLQVESEKDVADVPDGKDEARSVRTECQLGAQLRDQDIDRPAARTVSPTEDPPVTFFARDGFPPPLIQEHQQV
jgi:hypothetical protein